MLRQHCRSQVNIGVKFQHFQSFPVNLTMRGGKATQSHLKKIKKKHAAYVYNKDIYTILYMQRDGIHYCPFTIDCH